LTPRAHIFIPAVRAQIIAKRIIQTEKHGGNVVPTSTTAAIMTGKQFVTTTAAAAAATKPKVQSSVRQRLADKIGIKFK
jgi:hypothetical protein